MLLCIHVIIIQYFLYSWHEMGYYDIPAVTEFILQSTGHKQLTYIGHSMGTTMFWVFCTTRPELQHRVRQMHALAPIAFMSRMQSPLRNLTPYERELQVQSTVSTLYLMCF
jgi:pimeloyl-ACP methyl ester carboxylesterase